MRQLNEQNINIYDFPLTEDPQVDWMREQLPFAVVGSNTIIQVSAVVSYRSVLRWDTDQCCGRIQTSAVVGYRSVLWWDIGKCCGGMKANAVLGYRPVLWWDRGQCCCGIKVNAGWNTGH